MAQQLNKSGNKQQILNNLSHKTGMSIQQIKEQAKTFGINV